jgi:DNA-binding MarR family transcriptional regulator
MIMRPNLQTTLCCVCSRLFSRHRLIVPVFVFISAVSAHSFGQDQLSEREQALQPPKVFINPDETQYSSTRRIFQGIPRIERAADQYVLLSCLAEEDGITQQKLSSRCPSDARTIGTMIELLERNGLVERQPHPSDRRAWQVFLTKNGQARHVQLRENSEEIRKILHDALEPEEQAIVQKALDRIAEAFEQSHQTTGRTRIS